MKMHLKSLALALTLGGNTLALAQPGFDIEAMHRSGDIMARMAEHLQLSEEQQGEIQAIYASAQPQLTADREALGLLRDELALQVDDFDPIVAQDIADAIGDITGSMIFTKASVRADVHAVLTDEQLELLVQRHDEAEQRRAFARSFRRGGFHDGGASDM